MTIHMKTRRRSVKRVHPIPTLAHERHPCQVKDTVKFTKSDGTETWAYVKEVNGDVVTVIPVDEKGHVQPEM